MSATKQFCTFFLNNFFFGIEVLSVQEIIRFQEMTKVPMAPSTIEGLINLRGRIVTAIDLRRRLRFPERDADSEPTNVVVHGDDGTAVSLLVDEIGDVLDVEEDTFERPPENLAPSARDLITGVYKLNDRLLLHLDLGKTIAVSGSVND